MLQIFKTRLRQGHRTTRFPLELPTLPDRFRGRPALDATKCRDGCQPCVEACPTQAITVDGGWQLDLGRCLFCTACVDRCPEHAIQYTRDHRMAVTRRTDLVFTGHELALAQQMSAELHRALGRALRLREVCAGSCNCVRSRHQRA